jgi:hypothetical protein
MLRAKLLGSITLTAALAVSATPASAATMFSADGSPARAAAPTQSFMDYTDDDCMALDRTGSVTRLPLATKSGGEVCSSDSY